MPSLRWALICPLLIPDGCLVNGGIQFSDKVGGMVIMAAALGDIKLYASPYAWI